MSLVQKQAEFTQDVAKLINYSFEMGFVITLGEAHRTIEQQEIYVKSGRSKTMNSRHLNRLAIDLNFFKKTAGGKVDLTYKKEELQVIGDYWESLRPENRWGGNWSSFKDVPHFERR